MKRKLKTKYIATPDQVGSEKCVYVRGLMACISPMNFMNTETNKPHYEKTNDLVSDMVLHKAGCTITEDG